MQRRWMMGRISRRHRHCHCHFAYLNSLLAVDVAPFSPSNPSNPSVSPGTARARNRQRQCASLARSLARVCLGPGPGRGSLAGSERTDAATCAPTTRVALPFAAAMTRCGCEHWGCIERAWARRPHFSGPRCSRGTSPTGPAHALTQRRRRILVSLGLMAARMCRAQASPRRRAWTGNKQGPLPHGCSRPRLHRTRAFVPASPDLSSSTLCRPRQASPCSSCSHSRLRPVLPCRLYTRPCPTTASLLAAAHPRRCFSSFGPESSSHACMRATVLRSPTPTGYTTTTAQMLVDRLYLLSI
jgi:hypothetical protein